MIDVLQQINPLVTLLAFVIAIVSIGLMIVFYFKGRKAKKPTYYIKSHNLVTDFSSKIDKLQLLYGNTGIKNLTISRVAFWNDGAETIEWEDSVESDSLRIESVGDCDILDANVIKETNAVNKFHVEIVNSKLVRILFDFLDKGQGGAIQLIHTGKESSDIKIEGFVKGAGKPLPSYTRSSVLGILDKIFSFPRQAQSTKPHPVKSRRMMAIISFAAALFMLNIVFFIESSVPEKVFGIVVFLIYAYFGYILLKRRVPKGLEIVEEEEI